VRIVPANPAATAGVIAHSNSPPSPQSQVAGHDAW
jgi:hypothetical protein